MLKQLHQRRGGFTLVEIMIVVAIIALLAAIAVPGFLRARKRAQATKVLNELRLIDSAVDQYSIEHNLVTGNTIALSQLKDYFKVGSPLYAEGETSLNGIAHQATQTVDSLPEVPSEVDTALNDVVDANFWTPYDITGS